MLLPRYYFEKQSAICGGVHAVCILHAKAFRNDDKMKHIFYAKSGIYQRAVLTENGSECLLAYFGTGELCLAQCRPFNFLYMQYTRITRARQYDDLPILKICILVAFKT